MIGPKIPTPGMLTPNQNIVWIEHLLALLTTFEIAQYKSNTIAGQLDKNEDKTAHEHYHQ